MWLITCKTYIRNIEKKDFSVWEKIYFNKEQMRFFMDFFHSSRDTIVNQFNQRLKEKKNKVFDSGNSATFSIIDNNQVVGFISYYSGTRPQIISFAFILIASHQGKGVGKKSLELLFKQIEKDKSTGYLPTTVTHLEAQIDIRNIASMKTVTRLGFKKILSNIYCKGMVANIYRKQL